MASQSSVISTMSGSNRHKPGFRRCLIHLAAAGSWMVVFAVSHAAHAQEISELVDGSDTEKRTWVQLQKDGKAALGQDELISARILGDFLPGKLVRPSDYREGV